MHLTIGGVADQSGVSIETIRYYERIGLVPAPPRNAAGRRLYDAAAVRCLAFIRCARQLGFSIDEIRNLLALAQAGGACEEVEALTRAHVGRIRARIADLERMAAVLEATAARCDERTAPACPIIEALSEPASGETPAAAK